jgi:uncharacterized membrane protein YadS
MTTATAAPEKQSSKTTGLLVGLVMILAFAFLIAEIDAGISGWFKAQGIGKNPFEYPLTAAILGLIVNFVLRMTNTHDFIAPAIKTELFLKIGLVMMGVKVALGQILAKGFGGLIQGVIMVSSVFFFTWC